MLFLLEGRLRAKQALSKLPSQEGDGNIPVTQEPKAGGPSMTEPQPLPMSPGPAYATEHAVDGRPIKIKSGLRPPEIHASDQHRQTRRDSLRHVDNPDASTQ